MIEHRDEVATSMRDPRKMDPSSELVDRSGLSERDIDQVVRVLNALRGWHEASERMSAASRRYMKLNETDMRALRYLIAARNQNQLATPGDLTHHLGITSASTTKLLDRLEQAGHIERAPHPTDRRALTVNVTEATRADARHSVGRHHAQRFAVAAALTARQRDTVIAFLEALSATESTQLDPHHG